MKTDVETHTPIRAQQIRGRIGAGVVGATCLLCAAPSHALAAQDFTVLAERRAVIGVNIECASGQDVQVCPESPVVVLVTEGSAAALAGVRLRDRLVSIDGRRINSAEGVRAIRSLMPGVAVRLGLERAGHSLEVEAVPMPLPRRFRVYAVAPSQTLPEWIQPDSSDSDDNRFVFVAPDGRGSVRVHIARPSEIDSVRIEFAPGTAPEAGSEVFLLEDAELVRRVEEAEGQLRIRAREAFDVLTRARSLAPEPDNDRLRQRLQTLRATAEGLVAGAKFVSLTPAMAANLGAPRSGCLVLRVLPDTPAAMVGLQAGDIVTEVGGTPTGTLAMLHAAFMRAEATNELRVAWQRRGAIHNGVLVTEKHSTE